MESIKESIAETSLVIWVHCPYCQDYNNVTEILKEWLDDDLRATDIDISIKCDNGGCEETFIVNEITY